ncbi:lactoylglutathione lyase GLX1-like [Ziziphus jujuba]|uniref:Lactoylglutathione lyase GLX1-like n=1 Tax=Ziziphus jujuba TaxID=326968 RepID=A0A6P6GJL1_ZIZJJ|nr:lactoylglutathione lyase GLX1-like [Ziziphus jujuba]
MADSADSSEAVANSELLEWPKKDKRRLLHAVYRVGDLDRTIKFCTEALGMKLLRKRDVPEDKYSHVFLGFGPEESHFALEFIHYYGVTSYEVGTDFGHFAIATPDISKLVENIRANGGIIEKEPISVEFEGMKLKLGFVKDPDGCTYELIQREDPNTPEPLCQVMLCVEDLDRSINFYEKALGMKQLRRVAWPEYKFAIAFMAYGDNEDETTIIELTYQYGTVKHTKGNAYSQVAISTEDVIKSGEAAKLLMEELGGKILPEITNTKITSFVDPDGWKFVLVDNEYFLKELQSGRVIE